MTITETGAHSAAVTAKGGTWIEDWRPEDEAFWENGGKAIAKRNLAWSIFAEHLGFSVWLLCVECRLWAGWQGSAPVQSAPVRSSWRRHLWRHPDRCASDEARSIRPDVTAVV